MRPKRSIGVLLTAVLFGLGTTLVLPGVAAADNLGGVITADMNNDGIPDQVQLGDVGGPTSTTCSVTVSLGLSGGGFGTPKVHTYTSVEIGPFCPDHGVAMKLGNERKPDLVTSMSFGFRDLIVLHNFQPTAVYSGVIQPDWLRTADLNGDGRQDLIEWSSQVTDLTTLINTPQGTLVPGPFGVVTLRSGPSGGSSGPQYVLGDFNGDGGQDLLMSVNNQMSFAMPIVAEVFFGNGQAPAVLASTGDFRAAWTVFSIDLDFNGVPDAGVIETSGTGVTAVQYFHNDGAGHFTSVP
jgi:hypothetical protein